MLRKELSLIVHSAIVRVVVQEGRSEVYCVLSD